MILIAHRGLCDGLHPQMENHPDQIARTLARGFHAEIDVRWTEDGFYLGHDGPDHPVPLTFLGQPHLWLHAKDLATLDVLLSHRLNAFVHDQDDATLTASGHIWTFPGKPLFSRSICVQPEWNPDWRAMIGETLKGCAGICSKYVAEISRYTASAGQLPTI